MKSDPAIRPDDLRQICQVDGIVWWAERDCPASHTEKVLRGPTPMPGDLVFEVEENEMIARRIEDIEDGEIALSKHFIVDVINENYNQPKLVERDIMTRRTRPLIK